MRKKPPSNPLEGVPKQCKFCAFYEAVEDGGMCRRFPPLVAESDEGPVTLSLPTVDESDWCGEFRGNQ